MLKLSLLLLTSLIFVLNSIGCFAINPGADQAQIQNNLQQMQQNKQNIEQLRQKQQSNQQNNPTQYHHH